MQVSAYYLSPTGTAKVKAEAALMGLRLRAMRAQREAALLLDRAALPALPKFVLGVA